MGRGRTLTTGFAGVVATALVTGLLGVTGSSGAAAGAAAKTAADDSPAEVFKIYDIDPVNDPQGAWSDYAEMMLTPSVSTGHIPDTNPPKSNLSRSCPHKRCKDKALKVPSDVSVSGSMVRVIVPPGYTKKKNRKKRYPVVYLFNGALSKYDSWAVNTMLVEMSRKLGAIFVCPDGAKQPYPGMFTDWYDESFDWESFHTRVVMPWVDKKYRTLPKGRALVGASMGTLGALGYPIRHPGEFASVFSISGIVDTNLLRGNTLDPELAEMLGMAPPDLRRVWGHPLLQNANWDLHNPTANAEVYKDVELLVSSGTGYSTPDPEADDELHTGYAEQLMWTGHRTFLASLIGARVPFKMRLTQGNVHNWPWFDSAMRWGFPKIIRTARKSGLEELKRRKAARAEARR